MNPVEKFPKPLQKQSPNPVENLQTLCKKQEMCYSGRNCIISRFSVFYHMAQDHTDKSIINKCNFDPIHAALAYVYFVLLF